MWPKLFALYFPSFNGCKGWKLQKGTQSLGQPNYLAVTIEYRNCRLIRTWSKVKVALWNPNGLYSPWNSPGQNAGLGSLSLLQGNLPNSGTEPTSPALKADSLPSAPILNILLALTQSCQKLSEVGNIILHLIRKSNLNHRERLSNLLKVTSLTSR